jgi:hypothetical protein
MLENGLIFLGSHTTDWRPITQWAYSPTGLLLANALAWVTIVNNLDIVQCAESAKRE